MKLSVVVVMVLSISCNSKTQSKSDVTSSDSVSTYSNVMDKSVIREDRSQGERQYKDSAHFHIIRGHYISGAKFFEVYENKLSKLDDWKAYYEHGQLKEVGQMISVHHIYIGKWKYYAENGDLDSIVDYDEKRPVSYHQALKIAKKYEYSIPEIDVYLSSDSLNTYWQIVKSLNEKNRSNEKVGFIKINTKTGKVMIPKEEIYFVD